MSVIAVIKNNPVLDAAILGAGVTVAGSFGLHLNMDQTLALGGFAHAVLALVARSAVTPVTRVVALPASVVYSADDIARVH